MGHHIFFYISSFSIQKQNSLIFLEDLR